MKVAVIMPVDLSLLELYLRLTPPGRFISKLQRPMFQKLSLLAASNQMHRMALTQEAMGFVVR